MKIRESFARYDKFIIETITAYRFNILLVISVFIAGFFYGVSYKETGSSFTRGIIEGLFLQFKGLHGINFIIKIFVHNLLASLIFLTGIAFSIIPVISSLFNGFIIGNMSFLVRDITGLKMSEFVILLLPHGIFEIPAFILSLSLGTHLGTWPFRQNKRLFLKNSLKDCFVVFYKLILPLFLAAAIIEGTSAETFYRLMNG